MSNPESTSGSTEGQVVDTSQSAWAGRAGPIFWAGIVVGLLLTVGGFASLNGSLVGNTNGQLILCSGLGIVFGAFGSTGTAKYKGVVITGVAAIAIVLLVLVDYLIEDSYVELEITGDVDGAQIEVVGDENYLGAPRERRHDFIIIGRQIRKSVVTVSISPPIEEEEVGGEFLFECVRKEEIEHHFGSGKIIQWRFDKKKGQLVDNNTHRKIADVGGCPLAESTQHDTPWSRRLAEAVSSAFLSRAFAQEQRDTEILLQELEAGSAYTRRQARETLAKQGLSAVRPMLDRLVAGRPSYRIRVGIIVAMTEMLRQNKGDRAKFSNLMTQDDLNAFVDASGDRDRTIRVYASEFLYDLGDVRVIDPIFDRFTAADDTGKYNLLVALQGVYPALDAKDRDMVGRKLADIRGTVGPRTQELIDRMVANETSAEQHYWVIIGSYTDQSKAQAHADRINEENPGLKAFVGKRQLNNEYYPVIVGTYVGREQADALVKEALQLRSVREYGADPYLSAYADRVP